jgi:hypothetical protein
MDAIAVTEEKVPEHKPCGNCESGRIVEDLVAETPVVAQAQFHVDGGQRARDRRLRQG